MTSENRPAEDATEQLAELRAVYNAQPLRVRDVVYGKLAERRAVLSMLDAMSVQSGARMGTENGRDPLLDHVMGLIVGCAHLPEGDRVLVPDPASGAVVVGLSAEERAHFGG